MNESTAGAAQSALSLQLPAPPAALLRMAALMAAPTCDVDTLGDVIEADMALSSALLKTVNSAFFKLSGRVQTVREAITYLGHREVSAITLQNALRAAFPPAPELEALWQRATERSRWMGVVAQALGFDAWAAHSAGLFEECGKALLYRHAASRYRLIWAQAPADDALLVSLEMQAFGASHDILGAALCETWGLQASAVHSVRHHVQTQTTLALSGPLGHRRIAAVSALAHHATASAADFERCLESIAQQLELPAARLRAAISSLPPRQEAPA
ncbi:HDOD domain-containing protein [Roseateles sp. DXS20W]|uniref:HDOD domain-containing protein n=1 Tax=Pelomonas lactea TaxID=3299030 RepID=A0ABW7GJQ6_9BURK